MSYQVLARKWRPQTFSELVGQQHVVDAITNALDNNKLHHAYLFTGTRGVGKTTIARIFSKSLNCEEGQSANPCGKCNTCLDISEGRFVDLLEIDAASRTKVEDTRELLDNVQYKPTRGKYKVYLIDEVHMLSKHSFNALLKTLEEPPPHVKFLLATTDPQKLPVTILSRCLQFSLKSLSREQIQAQLSTILSAEQLSFEAPALSQIARAAAGSMRDALSLTDQAIAQGNNQVTLDIVVSMLGLLDKNQILRLANYICQRDTANAMSQLDEICTDSPDYSQVLSQLLALLHQVALTQIVPDICKLDTTVAKPIYTIAQSVSAEHIQLLYQIGLNGKRDLPFAPDAFTGLQMTIMRMLAFTPSRPLPLEISMPIGEGSGHDGVLANADKSDSSQATQSHTKSKPDAVVHSSLSNTDPITTDNDSTKAAKSYMKADNSESIQSDALPKEKATTEPASDANEAHAEADFEMPPIRDDLSNGMPEDVAAGLVYNHQPVSGTNIHDKGRQPLSDNTDENEGDDSVSQLQSLFDMEQDIASYEAQAAGDDGLKKPEQVIDEAATLVSSESINSAHLATSKSVSEHKERLIAELEYDDSVYDKSHVEYDREGHCDDQNKLDHQQETEPKNRPADAKDNSSIHTIFGETTAKEVGAVDTNTDLPKASLSNDTLNAYLDNGEKLTQAAQLDKWSAFVDSLEVRGLARQLLIHGRSQGIKDNCLVLEISESHHHLNEKSSVDTIEQAMLDKYQRNIELNVQYSEVENTPYQLQQKIDAMRHAHAKKVIESDMAIQELIKAFDAKVIQDSIESR